MLTRKGSCPILGPVTQAIRVPRAAPQRGLGAPALSEEEQETLVRSKRGRAERRGIFEAGREEMLAARPGKHIAVCCGEVLVADTSREVDEMTMRKRPGPTALFYSPGITCVTMF